MNSIQPLKMKKNKELYAIAGKSSKKTKKTWKTMFTNMTPTGNIYKHLRLLC